MAQIQSQRSIAPLKSWLFTPATKSDRFSRAATVHADALIIDLEDISEEDARTVLQIAGQMNFDVSKVESAPVDYSLKLRIVRKDGFLMSGKVCELRLL